MKSAVVAALWLAIAAAASAQSHAPAAPARCTLPESKALTGGEDRAASIARFEQLEPDCLKAVFLQCSQASREMMLDMGSAATCSVSYEALLRRGFGGNFNALLAWWRGQPDDKTALE